MRSLRRFFTSFLPKMDKPMIIRIIRWVFIAFCFVMLGFSIALLSLSVVTYLDVRTTFDELRTMKRFDVDMSDVKFIKGFRPEAALTIFYFGMAFGTFFTVISLLGFCGGCCRDRCFLISYAVLLTVVLLASFIGLGVMLQVRYEKMQNTIIKIYSEFVKYLYGQPTFLTGFFGMSIDAVQKQHHCCGVLNTTTESDTRKIYGVSPAYYVVLFWIESTQWGQRQMQSIKYKENSTMLWTPPSCCRERSANCSSGKFGDHYIWNNLKEEHWNKTIYTEGCGKNLLDFGHLPSRSRSKFIAFVVFGTISVLTTVVLAGVLVVYYGDDEGSDKEGKAKVKTSNGNRYEAVET